MHLLLQEIFNISRTGISDMYTHMSSRFHTSSCFDKQWSIKFINPIVVLWIEWIIHLVIEEWRAGKHEIKGIRFQSLYPHFERLGVGIVSVRKSDCILVQMCHRVTEKGQQIGVATHKKIGQVRDRLGLAYVQE